MQALQNGDADVIEPQPNIDLIAQLNQLGSAAKRNTGSGFTYDQLTFNLKSKFANPLLRSAYAKCLPRQEIIDKLVKPIDPKAEKLQARIIAPVQEGYDDIAMASGGTAYDKVDIEGAKADIAKSGVTDLTVNAVYLGNPNQRRQQTQQLIADSCGKAGFTFTVKALTPKEFGAAMNGGGFDVAQFGLTSTGLVSDYVTVYTSTSKTNYSRYSNPQMDQLLASLSQTSERDKQLDLTKQIETQLWKDLPNIPIFSFPLLNAFSPRISGVVLNTTRTQASFNASEWVKD